jgi:hypothetical protein
MRTILVVFLSVSLVGSANSAAGATPSLSQVLRFTIKGADDWTRRALILEIGAEFVARSSTFSDLLRRLGDARHVLLYLQFAQLRPPPPSGRTRFEVAPTRIAVGFIEIDIGQNPTRSRLGAILAHELAHAYEVSCLSQVRTTEELQQTLGARAASEGRRDSTETQFATAIEKAVLVEWSNGARIVSQLDELSAKHDLNACP